MESKVRLLKWESSHLYRLLLDPSFHSLLFFKKIYIHIWIVFTFNLIPMSNTIQSFLWLSMRLFPYMITKGKTVSSFLISHFPLDKKINKWRVESHFCKTTLISLTVPSQVFPQIVLHVVSHSNIYDPSWYYYTAKLVAERVLSFFSVTNSAKDR